MNNLQSNFADKLLNMTQSVDEITIEVASTDLLKICTTLKNADEFKFEQLMDVCGVDYSEYGISEWVTDKATGSGFERGVDESLELHVIQCSKPRFAVVYH